MGPAGADGRHAVEVCHELRQVVEASPETVGVGDRDFEANGLPDMKSTVSAEARTCPVSLCVATENVRPTAGDASVQEGCSRHRQACAKGGSPSCTGQQEDCARTKRQPVFDVTDGTRAIVHSIGAHSR